MNVIVNGQPIEPKAVTFSERTYGKAIGDLPLRLEMDADEFRRRLQPVYEACIAELKHDDAVTGRFHPPYPGASTYPTLDELLQRPAAERMPFIDTHLLFDMLRLWLPEESAASTWLLGRCEAVECLDGQIVITGKVRRAA
jgi:hypothetical protein